MNRTERKKRYWLTDKKRYFSKYCKEYWNIENYETALSEKFENWDLHHRDEVRFLPSGMVAIRSCKELIEAGRYFDCPANELIFMRRSEHHKLHSDGERNSMHGVDPWCKGKTLSQEIKAKMAETRKSWWQRRKRLHVLE